MTSDAGIIEFGADVYYKITDAVKSVTSVQDLNTQLRGLVRNRLMNTLTKFDLQAIEDRKDENIANIVVSGSKLLFIIIIVILILLFLACLF